MRLLLVCPRFFGYEVSVADTFRAQGWDVDLIDERPSNRAWARAAVRAVPSILKRQIDEHFCRQSHLFRNHNYDALLVIKGEVVPLWFLEEFAHRYPSATRAYFTFDAQQNSRHGAGIADYFPNRYSFDRHDVEMDPGFKYKPLFYTRDYAVGSTGRSLDLSFVGTLHSDRYRFAAAVVASIAKERRELFFYCQAQWYYWLQKIMSPTVRPVSREEVSFTPMSRAEVVSLTQRSRAVLDLQRVGQSGLTMRTFETLATGAGLITTNAAIREEPFYHDSKIFIVPRDPADIDPDAIADFVDGVSNVEAPTGFEAYSLDRWAGEFDELFRGVSG